MEFSTTSGASAPNDLIPNGVLLWAMLTHRGMKSSQSGGRYGDIELVIADNQPFARRKVWEKIGDPDFDANSEGYRNMGMVALTRMIEAGGLVDPKNPTSYEQMNGATCDQILRALDGKYVAIRIKIEPGKEGYQDQNKVADWLTPNEQSSGYKNFVKLSAGDHCLPTKSPVARAGTAGGGFGAGKLAPLAAAASFGKPAGFGANAGQIQGGAVEAGRPLADPAPLPASTQTSPSKTGGGFNPNKAPSFLSNHQR